ncbi:sigma factor-like helix-turn-helix DNA-binding protein, partial [Pseudomonas coronafaciens]
MAKIYSTVPKDAKHKLFPDLGKIVEALLPEFSPNEAKVIYLYTLGFSSRLISRELSISLSTIHTYRQRAKE